MKFLAAVNIMPLKEILDPQGKAVMLGLKNLGVSGLEEVRVGKHITLVVEALSEEEAAGKVDTACRKLLANLIMEHYEYQLTPLA
jgi:phosphoribosylformylglycinamidine synthase